MTKTQLIEKAILEAIANLDIAMPSSTLIISPSDPEKAEIDTNICGLEIVYAPTTTRFTLARCNWGLARQFEALLYKDTASACV